MSTERSPASSGGPVLEIRDLSVHFSTPGGEVAAVQGLSLDVGAGECVGVVGESGAGKSQAFLAVMGLLPANARVTGSARFGALDLIGRPPAELDRVRGVGVSMIFQDPLTSLTPHLPVGDQIAESLVEHQRVSWRNARTRALKLLEQVHVTDPRLRMTQFPHELSGGMRQRVMIAIALACEPRLLIADEPTTALDVTIQAQILALLADLKRERRMSMVLITHDLGVVAGIADRVAVMQAGQMVELGTTARILKHPEHAYTQALLRAVPRIGEAERVAVSDVPASAEGAPLLTVSDLRVQFKLRGGLLSRGPLIKAVDGASLTVQPGTAVGIVGESGSGKSTLARAVLRLLKPVSGQVVWLGQSLEGLSPSELLPVRGAMQLVFQDPLASLDPRMRVVDLVAEPLRLHRPQLDRDARALAVSEMLLRVGLGRNLMTRYPHELSGGQAQRVGIARAMVINPRLLVCDEAVSALDVSVQAQILALLQDLKREFQMSILFISHNLAVVRQLCERVLVLYLGRMMEAGPVQALYQAPVHPYTRGLLEAVPVPDPDIQPGRLTRTLGGELPSPAAPPSGCVFRTRCPHAISDCAEKVPDWEVVEGEHQVACLRWRELRLTKWTAAL